MNPLATYPDPTIDETSPVFAFTKIESAMTVKTANKHELKTRETRTLLLRAAETIFVRDGYEGAELGEIAALAGRTKGAIYAQFKSKEDIFLALIEDRVTDSRARMEKALAASTSVAENIAVVRAFYLERSQDHAWALLLLEYNLFVLRHPESKKRLQERFAALLSPNDEDRLVGFLGPVPDRPNAISRVVAIHTLQPLISVLSLEALLETNLSDPDVVRNVFNRVFDALLDLRSDHQ